MQAAVDELSSLLKAKFYLKEFILNTQYFMTPHTTLREAADKISNWRGDGYGFLFWES